MTGASLAALDEFDNFSGDVATAKYLQASILTV